MEITMCLHINIYKNVELNIDIVIICLVELPISSVIERRATINYIPPHLSFK